MSVPRVVRWQHVVRDHEALSFEAKGFAFLLSSYMSASTLTAWPSLATLEQVTGRSRRRLLCYRAELVEAGLLTVRAGGGRGRSTSYTGRLNGGADATVSGRETVADATRNSGAGATRTPLRGEHADDAATSGEASSSAGASPAGDPSPNGDTPIETNGKGPAAARDELERALRRRRSA